MSVLPLATFILLSSSVKYKSPSVNNSVTKLVTVNFTTTVLIMVPTVNVTFAKWSPAAKPLSDCNTIGTIEAPAAPEATDKLTHDWSAVAVQTADAFNSTYGDYQKSFNAKFDPLNANTFSASNNSNKQNNTETANLAMGETTQVSSNKKSKSKTTKNTSKYFAGMGVDESTKKRTFYV